MACCCWARESTRPAALAIDDLLSVPPVPYFADTLYELGDIPPAMRPFHMDNNRAYIDSGDLVFFQGTGRGARLIQCLTGSSYSHVGIVLRRYNAADDTSLPFLIESVGHTDGLICADHRTSLPGVRIVPLELRLRQYAAESRRPHVRICTIKNVCLSSEALTRMSIEAALEDFLSNTCEQHYSESPTIHLAEASLESLLPASAAVATSAHDAALTCTELVVAALKAIGTLAPTVSASLLLTPRAFLESVLTHAHFDKSRLDTDNIIEILVNTEPAKSK